MKPRYVDVCELGHFSYGDSPLIVPRCIWRLQTGMYDYEHCGARTRQLADWEIAVYMIDGPDAVKF